MKRLLRINRRTRFSKYNMAGSSSASYSWTSTKVEAALHASLQVVSGGKEDPISERNILKTVSKLNATCLFNSSTSGEVLTPEALRTFLYQQRERYQRICQIADLPYSSFSRFQNEIRMVPTNYEHHIKVCRDLEIGKASFIVNLYF